MSRLNCFVVVVILSFLQEGILQAASVGLQGSVSSCADS